MKCAKIREQMALLVLGLLSQAETRRIEEHAAACPACQAEMARLQCAHLALASAADQTPAVELTDRVLRRIASRPASRPWFAGWMPLAAGTALLAAVLIAPWARGPEPLSTSEVIQAYNEDYNALSPYGTAATVETVEPTWGFPTELAAWINSN